MTIPKEVVVDTSLAVKWVMAEHDSRAARMRLRRWRSENTRLIVPCWFACEFANVLHQHVRQGTVSTPQAIRFLRPVLDRVSLLDPEPTVAVPALEIASLLNQKASYDSQYVALAEHLGCELWTADQRFGRLAQATFPFVHWLGEPVPTGTGQAGP